MSFYWFLFIPGEVIIGFVHENLKRSTLIWWSLIRVGNILKEQLNSKPSVPLLITIDQTVITVGVSFKTTTRRWWDINSANVLAELAN